MKQLWAPWRMAYIDNGDKEPGCIFCTKFNGGDPREGLVLSLLPHSVVMLNKYPYNNGHLLIAPRRHENNLANLPAEEYLELSSALQRSIEVVRQALKPGGMNVGMNLGKCAGAGVEDHLHWHIVPRWEGDTNFMPVVGETRVMPQHLLESYDRLQPYFTSNSE